MRVSSYGHQYNSSEDHHIEKDDECLIEVRSQGPVLDGEPYPVLHIGRVTFYPSVDQLRTLRSAVSDWLRAHDEKARDDGHRPPVRQAAPTDPTDAANLQASEF